MRLSACAVPLQFQAPTGELRGRVIFIEDYDMNVARHLVQGVDVWLNNPVYPLEASGTTREARPVSIVRSTPTSAPMTRARRLPSSRHDVCEKECRENQSSK